MFITYLFDVIIINNTGRWFETLLGREFVWRCEWQDSGWFGLWLWYIRSCSCTVGCRVSSIFPLFLFSISVWFIGLLVPVRISFFTSLTTDLNHIVRTYQSISDYKWSGQSVFIQHIFDFRHAMLQVLQFLGRHVTGIDIDPESLELASSNAEYLEVLSFDFMYDCHVGFMLGWDTLKFCIQVLCSLSLSLWIKMVTGVNIWGPTYTLLVPLKIAVGNGLGSVWCEEFRMERYQTKTRCYFNASLSYRSHACL